MENIYPHCHDAVYYAGELGRLDFVSCLLACIGILLAIAGFCGFWYIKHMSARIAEDTSREICEKIAERVANEYLLREFPKILAEYTSMAANMTKADQANSIAAAQEENDGS